MGAGLIQSIEDFKSKDWGFPEKKKFCPEDCNIEIMPEFSAS